MPSARTSFVEQLHACCSLQRRVGQAEIAERACGVAAASTNLGIDVAKNHSGPWALAATVEDCLLASRRNRQPTKHVPLRLRAPSHKTCRHWRCRWCFRRGCAEPVSARTHPDKSWRSDAPAAPSDPTQDMLNRIVQEARDRPRPSSRHERRGGGPVQLLQRRGGGAEGRCSGGV